MNSRITLRHLALLLGVCFAVLRGQAKESLYLGTTEQLPTLGLEFKPFRGFASQPWPGTHAVGVENTRTGEKLDAYKARELWVTEQVRGYYKGETGSIVVAEVTQQRPSLQMPMINEELVLEPIYREAMKTRQLSSPKADDIREWVEYFTGESIEAESGKVRDAKLAYPYRAYTFKNCSPETLQAWIFLANHTKDNDTYILVLFQLDDHADVTDATGAMARCVSTAKWIGRKAADQGPNTRMTASSSGSGKRVKRSAEYEAARKRVIDNIGNLKNWWYVELPSYILASNLDTRNRGFVNMIQEDMEIMRGAYSSVVPESAPINDVSVIRIFSDRKDYQSYVPSEMSWSSGIWMPGKKELVVSPVEMGNKRDSRTVMLSVVYHEGFHQYLFYALGGLETPIWFNEGHAAFFEGSKVDNSHDKVEVEENDLRTKLIDFMLDHDGSFHVDRLIAMSQPEFYSRDIDVNYSRAYGVVYFLRKAAPQYPGRGYETLCDKILATVQSSHGNQAAVVETITKNVDMERFDADLKDFWGSKTNRRKAERNNDYASHPTTKPPVGK